MPTLSFSFIFAFVSTLIWALYGVLAPWRYTSNDIGLYTLSQFSYGDVFVKPSLHSFANSAYHSDKTQNPNLLPLSIPICLIPIPNPITIAPPHPNPDQPPFHCLLFAATQPHFICYSRGFLKTNTYDMQGSDLNRIHPAGSRDPSVPSSHARNFAYGSFSFVFL